MASKRHDVTQILAKLREAEVELGRGKKTGEVCRKLGVTEQTFYRWKSKFGGMEVSDAKKLRQLEDENRRLKTMVADLMLDNKILKDVNSKNW